MTEDEMKLRLSILEAIEDLDDEVLLTIIDCCKELHCNGTALWAWDRDSIMSVLDKVLNDNMS